MATTPIRGVPYVLNTDPIVNYPAASLALANLIDAGVLYLGKNAADPPSAYPLGVSVLTVNTALATSGGWPDAVSATVQTVVRYDPGGTIHANQIWTQSSTVPFQRVRTASLDAWGPWITLANDPGWTTFASSVTGTSRYRKIGNVAYVQVDGTVSIATGTTITISTTPLPAAVRPTVVARGGASFTGYAGVIAVQPNGNVEVIQQSGATRTTMSAVLAYPLG